MKILGQRRLLWGAGAPLALILGRAVYSTMQIHFFGAEHLMNTYQKYGQVIIAFWHNRLLLLPFIYRYDLHLKNLVVMASRSRDGQYISELLERFGFCPIRGSSSKGGMKTFVQAIKMARKGYDVAITPDGPRGPRYKVQPGVIKLAQITSIPILPVAYQSSVRLEMNSWDGFIMPGPFAKISVDIAPPITVPRRAGSAQLEETRKLLQRQLESLNKSTLAHLKRRGQPPSVLEGRLGDRHDWRRPDRIVLAD